jgi:hypothetical protein
MTRISLFSAAVAVSLLSSGAFLASANAASNSRMQACGAQWQSMKTAGTSGAMKWTDFLKTCGAGAQPAAAVAPAVTAQAAPKAAKVSKAAKAAAALAAAATPASAPVAAAAAAAPAPVVAAASPVSAMIKKFTTKSTAPQPQPAPVAASGSAAPATGGRLAEQTRIKACGVQWQSAKAANSIPAGQTWPQFWSACDTRLKAANG